jgi:hypothetical protein
MSKASNTTAFGIGEHKKLKPDSSVIRQVRKKDVLLVMAIPPNCFSENFQLNNLLSIRPFQVNRLWISQEG